ncbi:hypothetical protein BBJ28_00010651 [Nothophytophthora sp. Chile5]|nr:hypothetical protein BBJ28_00010651 [Nothophytophthora sp. Chile5]
MAGWVHLTLQSEGDDGFVMMDAIRTEHGDLRASPDDAIHVTTPADAGQQRLTATYGLRALATVVFDIDSGQKLDALYPPTCGLSEAAKTSLAHLALPHSNNQDEGDTQFTVRFRDAPDESVALSAGTYISCIIPKLLDYDQVDAAFESTATSPSQPHFIVEADDDVTGMGDFHAGEEDVGDEEDGDTEETVLVRGGQFVVSRRQQPPSPSFGDLLLSKRTHQTTPFENIGLYSSFMGLESSLWLLWQLAITGESFLILSPHARTCSQAALAFTRYERLLTKAFVFIGAAGVESASETEDAGSICLRIQKNVELDDFENSDHAMLLRRCPRYLVPDTTILRQLISPPEVHVTQTASMEEEPYATINNAVLRQDYMKAFSLPSFLASIKPRKLPPQIKLSKWKALYTAFVHSPHFEPWFNYRRQRCIHHFANTLRTLRQSIDADLLLSSPFGDDLSQEQCVKLQREMEVALELEKARGEVDKQHIRIIKKHLKAVKQRLRSST